jgi:hypothetical protein
VESNNNTVESINPFKTNPEELWAKIRKDGNPADKQAILANLAAKLKDRRLKDKPKQ